MTRINRSPISIKIITAVFSAILNIIFVSFFPIILGKEIDTIIFNCFLALIIVFFFDTIRSSYVKTKFENSTRTTVSQISKRQTTIWLQVEARLGKFLKYLIINLGKIVLILDIPSNYTLTLVNKDEINQSCFLLISSSQVKFDVINIVDKYPKGLYLKYSATTNIKHYNPNEIKTIIDFECDKKWKNNILKLLAYIYMDLIEAEHTVIAGERD